MTQWCNRRNIGQAGASTQHSQQAAISTAQQQSSKAQAAISKQHRLTFAAKVCGRRRVERADAGTEHLQAQNMGNQSQAHGICIHSWIKM